MGDCPFTYNRTDQYPNGVALPDSGFMYAFVRSGTQCPGNPSRERMVDECGYNITGDNWEKMFPSRYYDLPMLSISAKAANEIFGIIGM